MKAMPAQNFATEVTQTPTAEDLKAIENGLISHSQAIMAPDRKTICVFLRDNDGTIKAGLYGRYVEDTFVIKNLWVHENLRGQGYGRVLMLEAEEQANQFSCGKMVVDTMSYQAPEFYKKLGYTEVAVVKNYYAGHDRIFFEKLFRL